jgi:hypothetical protein
MVITGILVTRVTTKSHEPKYLEKGVKSTQIKKNFKENYDFYMRKSRMCYTFTGDTQIPFNTIKDSIQYFFFLN